GTPQPTHADQEDRQADHEQHQARRTRKWDRGQAQEQKADADDERKVAGRKDVDAEPVGPLLVVHYLRPSLRRDLHVVGTGSRTPGVSRLPGVEGGAGVGATGPEREGAVLAVEQEPWSQEPAPRALDGQRGIAGVHEPGFGRVRHGAIVSPEAALT